MLYAADATSVHSTDSCFHKYHCPLLLLLLLLLLVQQRAAAGGLSAKSQGEGVPSTGSCCCY
jgi:hypothetical protein